MRADAAPQRLALPNPGGSAAQGQMRGPTAPCALWRSVQVFQTLLHHYWCTISNITLLSTYLSCGHCKYFIHGLSCSSREWTDAPLISQFLPPPDGPSTVRWSRSWHGRLTCPQRWAKGEACNSTATDRVVLQICRRHRGHLKLCSS